MKKFDLNNSTKKTPFELPDGYFEEFPMRMQQRIQQEARVGTSGFWAYPVWKLASAAMVLLFIAWVGYNGIATDVQEEQAVSSLQERLLEGVDNEAILSYLEEHENINTSELYDLAQDIYIEEIETESLLENNFLEEVDIHELDDYM